MERESVAMFIYKEDEERFVKALHPEIQKYYWIYHNGLADITIPDETELESKKSYVYAWYTKGDNKKTFYIGKGTGSRFKHILKEIQEFEKNPKRYKGCRYKLLNDLFGIDYEILLTGISNYEAEVFEYIMIQVYFKKGEVLLNYAEIPSSCLQVTQWDTPDPAIIKDPFYSHYLNDNTIPTFDTVTTEKLLSASFYNYLFDNTMEQEKTRQIISEWIKANGGKITRNIGKSTKCIIIQGKYKYEHVLEDHKNNRDVYSDKDVLAFIAKK